ncbi:uncharacterized protein LOC132745501 [Ruditapes philippinarum]|uniref:uncharacterized protein LOC132745501 n=1 Tax=Ruditapes philippinarum TaxID=129788 RepID=UPI00295B5420|nr:uncharacterized protein LOC132745501 [Ruditapes philippinarum]
MGFTFTFGRIREIFSQWSIFKARHHYIKQLAELNLSVQEESLLRAIVILFTDRCKLEHPAVVDALQEKMVMCLQHLINIRPGGSGTLLYKIFKTIITQYTGTY